MSFATREATLGLVAKDSHQIFTARGATWDFPLGEPLEFGHEREPLGFGHYGELLGGTIKGISIQSLPLLAGPLGDYLESVINAVR